uniref:Uncharacterized protein n=1 Tax=Cotesia sesamiae Kitale bracovirus TaxID=452648 RepID=S0DH76_9VIRU|nr:conserved hypothetical protein BV19 [Cotesia sesamiae Kitale bracovirus]
MMFNKTIITLCVVIVGAAGIEATDEHMTSKESLVILESPPVYLNPVSHLTFEKSTAPLPSSTTEDDLSQQLSELLHNTEYLLSEEIEFIGAATTESGISKKGSSPATQTDEEFILEELILPVQSDKDEITSQQNKSSIESIFDFIIIVGSITIVILIIVLYFVIVAYCCCIRKTSKLDCSKFGIQATPDGKEAKGLSPPEDFARWFKQKYFKTITDEDRASNDSVSRSTTSTIHNTLSDEGSGQDDPFTDDDSGLPASTSEDEVTSLLPVTTTEDLIFKEPASTSVVIEDASEKSGKADQHSSCVIIIVVSLSAVILLLILLTVIKIYCHRNVSQEERAAKKHFVRFSKVATE